MRDLLEKHRNKLITLALPVIPLLLILSTTGTGIGQHRSTGLGRLSRSVVSSTQLAMVNLVGGLGGALTQKLVSDEQQQLRLIEQDVQRLREEKARLIGILQENARLRKLVGFTRDHPEYTLVPARVVARNTTPYFRVITVKVELDASSPILPRMPVVVSGGVVGQVHEVQDGYAEIVVLSDPRSRLDAISQRNRAHGVVIGLGNERDYQAKVSYLSEKDVVRAGDVMVTSGMGGVFPRELLIGRIVESKPDERGLFQQVKLEPMVDFSRLEEVFIITRTQRDTATPDPTTPAGTTGAP